MSTHSNAFTSTNSLRITGIAGQSCTIKMGIHTIAGSFHVESELRYQVHIYHESIWHLCGQIWMFIFPNKMAHWFYMICITEMRYINIAIIKTHSPSQISTVITTLFDTYIWHLPNKPHIPHIAIYILLHVYQWSLNTCSSQTHLIELPIDWQHNKLGVCW